MAGTAFELVLLSSSPPASSPVTIASPPSYQQRVRMSTISPPVPSPPGNLKTKTSGMLQSGSNAAPAPEGASRGFASAASLVKSHHFGGELIQEPAAESNSQSRRSSVQYPDATEKASEKPRKRATKAAAQDGGTEPKPKKTRARKPKANQDEHMQEAASHAAAPTTSFQSANAPAIEPPSEPLDNTAAPFGYTKSGKPRKRRAPKEKSENRETQTTIPKAKITKSRSTSKSTGKKALKATEAVSSHFANGVGKSELTHSIGTENGAGTHITAEGNSSIRDTSASPRRERAAPIRNQNQTEQSLDLAKADSRRRDWTPTKDTSRNQAITESAGKENHSAPTHEESVPFLKLVSNFSYAHLETQVSAIPRAPLSVSTGVTKKRRVELVDMPGDHGASKSNTSPEKVKAPKKKPRTITDFVTEQYAAPIEAEHKSSVTSELIAAPASFTTKVPLNDVSDSAAKRSNAKQPRKRASSKSASGSEVAKSKPKPKSKKASTKAAVKPKLIVEKLLSPTSALLKIGRQDVLYGTSSQLALEDSPTLIRHIQQAIKESEQVADNVPGLADAMGPPLWPRLGKVAGKRGLWAASARGDDGQLLEKLEDVYIPVPDRTQDLPLLMDGSYDDDPDASFADIDDIPVQISSDLPTPPEPVLKSTERPPNEATPFLRDEAGPNISFDNMDDHGQAPPPSNQKAESSFLDIDDFPTQSYTPSQPPLTMFTNTESNFLDIDDFSPQSFHLASNKPSSMPPPTTSTGSPKKHRGRSQTSRSVITARTISTPTKEPSSKEKTKMTMSAPARPSTPQHSKGRFADIEEIMDSEDDEALSPTPPRIDRSLDSALPLIPAMPTLAPKAKSVKSATRTPKASKSLTTTSGSEAETPQVFQIPLTQLEWASSKLSVFKRITAAIRALAPTAHPQNPSWHEKILLYDAIVLEDLTSFLAQHTSVRAFKRATQKQIKAWNRVLAVRGEKGLPEVGLGIGAKMGEVIGTDGKTETVELINVVEKEVEVWMVREWCQEMSVCGISKVRGGRTGMGKGLY